MAIHKEGYKILAVGFIILLIFNVLVGIFWSENNLVKWVLLFFSLLLYLFLLFFFRFPARKLDPDPGLVYAPADGKIVVIEETEEMEYFKEGCRSRSSSPFNMHSNRYPVSGNIKYVHHHEGII
jgi:phosphatidylserine decarboxylase